MDYTELPGPPGGKPLLRSPWVTRQKTLEETEDEETNALIAEETTPQEEDYAGADEVGGTWTWNSLNFDEFVNDASIKEAKKWRPRRRRFCFGYTGKTFARWVVTCAIGVTMGSISIALARGSEFLIELRDANSSKGDGVGLLVFSFWSFSLSFLASSLVAFYAPGASGSGIQVVKAYLNGVRLEGCLSARVFFVKLLGTLLAVGSGASLGPEGPLVHLGAMVGSFFTGGLDPTSICVKLRDVLYVQKHQDDDEENPRSSASDVAASVRRRKQHKGRPPAFFHSDVDRRDFLSIGAACGFAAAFGSPIGGILFSLEEASSFWSNELLWRSLVGASIAAFTALTLEHGIVGLTEISHFGLISLRGSSQPREVSLALVPMAVIAGIFGGVLGAAFNEIWYRGMKLRQFIAKNIDGTVDDYLKSNFDQDDDDDDVMSVSTSTTHHITSRWWWNYNDSRGRLSPTTISPDGDDLSPTRRKKKLSTKEMQRIKSRCKAIVRVLDATVGVLLTSLVFYITTRSVKKWACVNRDRDDDGWLDDEDFVRKFNCKSGEVHELASLWLGTREKAIKKILAATNGELSSASLALSGALTLVTLGLSFGSALPGGLFLPLIYCGACLGSAAARIPVIVDSPLNITRRHSALLGAVALLAGVQRSTVSLCVIMLEGTGNTSLLIPIIVVVCVARFVGNLLGEGLYELSIDLQKVPFLFKHVPRHLDEAKVIDLCQQRPIAVLPVNPTPEQAAHIIMTSHHGAYPVVVTTNDDDEEEAKGHQKLIGLVLREHVKALLCASAYASRHEGAKPPGLASALSRASYDTGSASRPRLPSTLATDSAAFDAVSRAPSTDVAGAYSGLEEPPFRSRIPSDLDPVALPTHRLDLASAMVRSPYVVYDDCPLSRAYRLFVTMGARHLLVIDHFGDLKGILTRHDMLLHHHHSS